MAGALELGDLERSLPTQTILPFYEILNQIFQPFRGTKIPIFFRGKLEGFNRMAYASFLRTRGYLGIAFRIDSSCHIFLTLAELQLNKQDYSRYMQFFRTLLDLLPGLVLPTH